MKPVSAEVMRCLDLAATADFHIPSLILMENAGRGVSEIISRKWEPCRVEIFAGKGNNGGDGLVVARHLTNRGFSVHVTLLSGPNRLKGDALINYQIIQKSGIPISHFLEGDDVDFSQYCSEARVIVDAIFGFGLNSKVCGIFEKAIQAINACAKPVISIDIPSGLDADSGEILGTVVKADITATLALPKTGLLKGQGPAKAGRVEIVDIGVPSALLRPYLD